MPATPPPITVTVFAELSARWSLSFHSPRVTDFRFYSLTEKGQRDARLSQPHPCHPDKPNGQNLEFLE